MKAKSLYPLVLGGLMATAVVPAFAVEKADAQSTSHWTTRISRTASGTDDVIRLVKSGVDNSVVLAYVKSSHVAYNPSADEIIQLRDQGVSSEVISAMLQRGAELRAESQKAYAATAAQTAATTATAPSCVAPATTTTYVEQPASSVIYIPHTPRYTYSYYYPGSYYYGGYYPRYWSYPSLSFHYGGRSHYSFGLGWGYGGVGFGGYYGGHHGGHHRGYRHCR